MRFAASFVLAASLVVLAACGGTGGDPLTPPEGWTSNGADAALAAWWHADVDTAVAFRDLSTLETMGVDEGEGLVAQVKRGRLDGAEKADPDGGLIGLFRNNPEAMDSVFNAVAVPLIQQENASSVEDVRSLRTDVYYRVSREYRKSGPLGQIDPSLVIYPDSLRQNRVEGSVTMQVHVDRQGQAVAAKVLEPAHPTLDRLALNVAANRRYNPATAGQDSVASWLRISIPYYVPGG
ncbi:MAG: energy transducer TonB [Bacteroidota bacterium]